MKKLLYVIAIVISLPCIAMEQESKLKSQQAIVLRKINGVKNPCCGSFFKEGEVIISDANDCSTYNAMTGNKLKEINKDPSQHIALHPNGTLCTLSYGRKVKIYDVETGILTCKTENNYHRDDTSDFIASITIPKSPNDYIIMLMKNHCQTIDFYKEKFPTHRMNIHIRNGQPPTIALHPTEPIICIAENEGRISFCDTDADTFDIFKPSSCPPVDIKRLNISNRYPKVHRFCQFNHNGSLLVIGEAHRFWVVGKNGTLFDKIFEKTKTLHDVIFHPNGEVLITLSQPNNEITYWDIPLAIVATPIISMSCSSAKDNPPTEHRHMHPYLSCDPRGKYLLAVLSNECLMMPVPFEAIYKLSTKEKDKYILSYLILQKYLPKDVLHMFIRKQLRLCKKRKLENNATI